ncbi:MAG: hypothetical protein ACLFQV_03240 [Vulcanimicrobiota bacterium]
MGKKFSEIILSIVFVFIVNLNVFANSAEDYVNLYQQLISPYNPQNVIPLLEKNRQLLDENFISTLEDTSNGYLEKNNNILAIQDLSILAGVYHLRGDQKQEAEILLQLSDMYIELFLYKGAGKSLERLGELEEGLKDPLITARVLSDQGLLNFRQFNYDEAARSIEKSQKIAQKQGFKEVQSKNLRVLGNIAYVENQPEKGEEYYQESIKLAREAVNNELLLKTYMVYSVRLAQNRDFATMDENFIQLGNYFLAEKDPVKYARTLEGRAELAKKRLQGQEYRSLLEQARQIYMEQQAYTREASVLVKLARNSSFQRHHQEAMEQLQEARYLFNRDGNIPGYLNVISQLAYLNFLMNNYEKAIGYAEEAKEGYSVLGLRSLEYVAVRFLITANKKTGNPEEVEKYEKELEELKQEIGKKKIARINSFFARQNSDMKNKKPGNNRFFKRPGRKR